MLTVARTTITLRGTAAGAEQVWAKRADGAHAWAWTGVDDTFALGLGPGIWTVQSRNYSPLRVGLTQTIVVDSSSILLTTDLAPPPP